MKLSHNVSQRNRNMKIFMLASVPMLIISLIAIWSNYPKSGSGRPAKIPESKRFEFLNRPDISDKLERYFN